MPYRLEEFSPLRLYKQAHDIKALVARQTDWLTEIFPAGEAYKSLPSAALRIARLALNRELRAYIIRRGSVARGLATIIFDQNLRHPDTAVGLVNGHDIDYWLERTATPEDHQRVTNELLLEARETHLELFGKERPCALMAARRTESDLPQAEGLYGVLAAAGQPAQLATTRSIRPDATYDPYGLTKNGALLQLYRWEIASAETT